MRHKRVFQLLPGYLEGFGSERERRSVEKHLATCSSCQETLAEWKVISEVVATQPSPPVPAGMLATLLNSLDTVDLSRRAAPITWQKTFALVSILLMLIAVWLMPDAQVSISLGSSEGMASLRVYRGETAVQPQEIVLDSLAPALSADGAFVITDPSVRPGRSYSYWLEAQTAAGETSLAGPYSVTPDYSMAIAKVFAAVCLLVGLAACLWVLLREIYRPPWSFSSG